MSRPPTTLASQLREGPRRGAKARHSRKGGRLSWPPMLGLLLILLGTLFVLRIAPWWSPLPIVSSALAILGGWLRKPLLQKTGVGFMLLLSVGWLALAYYFYADERMHPHPFMLEGLGRSFGNLSLGVGVFTGLCALLLSPRWRPVEDETPEEKESPG